MLAHLICPKSGAPGPCEQRRKFVTIRQGCSGMGSTAFAFQRTASCLMGSRVALRCCCCFVPKPIFTRWHSCDVTALHAHGLRRTWNGLRSGGLYFFFAFIICCKAHTRQVIVFFECCWLAPPFFLPPPYFAFSCGMMKRMKTFAHRNGNYNALSTMDGAPLPTGHSASAGMESGENWTRQRKCNTVLLCCWKCARAGGLISSANNNARALLPFPFPFQPWAPLSRDGAHSLIYCLLSPRVVFFSQHAGENF